MYRVLCDMGIWFFICTFWFVLCIIPATAIINMDHATGWMKRKHFFSEIYFIVFSRIKMVFLGCSGHIHVELID
jgi:hypothetical protein